jgi:CBS domain containing-hemolysin-like protein
MSSVGTSRFRLIDPANGIFAMSEMALVSARKTRLEREASLQRKHALHWTWQPPPTFSTVQVGITLVGILAGDGGATVAPRSGGTENVAWTAHAGRSASRS